MPALYHIEDMTAKELRKFMLKHDACAEAIYYYKGMTLKKAVEHHRVYSDITWLCGFIAPVLYKKLVHTWATKVYGSMWLGEYLKSIIVIIPKQKNHAHGKRKN